MLLQIYSLDGDFKEIEARSYSLKPGWLTIFFDDDEEGTQDCHPTDNIDMVRVVDA